MKNIFKNFIVLIILIFCFSTPVSATGLTDIDDIGNMFTFTNSNDDSLLDSSMQFSASNEESSSKDFWNKLFREYKGIILGISGIVTLTFCLLFLFNFSKLGTTAGNPQARKSVVNNLLWTGLGAAAAGSVAMFVGFGLNILN